MRTYSFHNSENFQNLTSKSKVQIQHVGFQLYLLKKNLSNEIKLGAIRWQRKAFVFSPSAKDGNFCAFAFRRFILHVVRRIKSICFVDVVDIYRFCLCSLYLLDIFLFFKLLAIYCILVVVQKSFRLVFAAFILFLPCRCSRRGW